MIFLSFFNSIMPLYDSILHDLEQDLKWVVCHLCNTSGSIWTKKNWGKKLKGKKFDFFGDFGSKFFPWPIFKCIFSFELIFSFDVIFSLENFFSFGITFSFKVIIDLTAEKYYFLNIFSNFMVSWFLMSFILFRSSWLIFLLVFHIQWIYTAQLSLKKSRGTS